MSGVLPIRRIDFGQSETRSRTFLQHIAAIPGTGCTDLLFALAGILHFALTHTILPSDLYHLFINSMPERILLSAVSLGFNR